MLKIFNKILIGARRPFSSIKEAFKMITLKGLFKNPLFYFGLISMFLFMSVYASCGSFVGADSVSGNAVFFNSFFNKPSGAVGDSLFSSQATAIPLETPDLKIIQNDTLCAQSTPCVVSGKVLGDAFGGNSQNQKDVVNYVVQPGDTLQSIASSYNISVNTLLWANDLTSSSTIKVGQNLTVLPVDGVLHAVKTGDTVSGIAQTYKAQPNDIISYNGLANQDDIYIGDVLIIPGGVMPKKSSPIVDNQVPLADNYFIFPAQGIITQGLHYFNAVDLANKCGTPIYAAAAGVVQRAVFNNSWNMGMGNYVTILHGNGTVTYYGHFEDVLVKPGDKVYTGENIGLMGRTGDATGCHVHFEVIGARNPLASYPVGSRISYK